jgi:hypothetical protein
MILPCFPERRARPQGVFNANIRIPIDDEHENHFRLRWTRRGFTEKELYDYKYGGYVFPLHEPGTYLAKQRKDNDYGSRPGAAAPVQLLRRGAVPDPGPDDDRAPVGTDREARPRAPRRLGPRDHRRRRRLLKMAKALADGIEPEEPFLMKGVREGSFNFYTVNDRRPKYSIVDTPYGSMYGAYRPADEGNYYWRVAQFLFPFYTQIPTGVLGHQILTRAWVPMDDDHMMFFSMASSERFAFATGAEQPNRVFGLEVQPNTTDWFGRFNLVANDSNDYQIDREKQRTTSFTGIEGIPLQDQAITESMGTLLNRSLEHLGTSDIMVARVRNRLQQAALGLVEKQITPPGVDEPEVYRVRSGGAILPRDQDWLEGIAPLLPAYTDHPDLDISRG